MNRILSACEVNRYDECVSFYGCGTAVKTEVLIYFQNLGYTVTEVREAKFLWKSVGIRYRLSWVPKTVRKTPWWGKWRNYVKITCSRCRKNR